MNLKVWPVTKTTLNDFSDDNITSFAAALSYYTVLSIAPLLLVAVYLAGAIYGRGAVRQELMDQVSQNVGQDVARLLDHLMTSIVHSGHGTLALALGIAGVLFGATTIFAQVQSTLNVIWDVKVKPGKSLSNFLRQRLGSFVMMLVLGALVIASMAVSAVLSAAESYTSSEVLGWVHIGQWIDYVVSFVVLVVLFAAVYKILPDVHIKWKQVWFGAMFTAVLFMVGKFLIMLYLHHASPSSAYGAAGSLVILLVWVYYSSIIFFLGAEFTQAYMRVQGRPAQPVEQAERAGHKSDQPT